MRISVNVVSYEHNFHALYIDTLASTSRFQLLASRYFQIQLQIFYIIKFKKIKLNSNIS